MKKKKELIKWTQDLESKGWFKLSWDGDLTFKQFLDDVLDRKDNEGTIYVQFLDSYLENDFEASTYRHGQITWISRDLFDRMDDYILVSAQADGFPTNINYHVQVRRPTDGS